MNFLTLIGQMGTFLVLWWFVYKFIWPLLAQAVAERQQKIAEGLSMADNARFSMLSAKEESDDLLLNAKNQANEIVPRAQREADKLVNEAREEAKNAGKRELENAREEIEQEKRKAREALRQQLASLVIQGVQQVVAREVKAEDHAHLLRELSEKL